MTGSKKNVKRNPLGELSWLILWFAHWTSNDTGHWLGHCVLFLGKTLLTTLTVPLSTQEYKWVVANYQGNLTYCKGGGGEPIIDFYPIQGRY